MIESSVCLCLDCDGLYYPHQWLNSTRKAPKCWPILRERWQQRFSIVLTVRIQWSRSNSMSRKLSRLKKTFAPLHCVIDSLIGLRLFPKARVFENCSRRSTCILSKASWRYNLLNLIPDLLDFTNVADIEKEISGKYNELVKSANDLIADTKVIPWRVCLSHALVFFLELWFSWEPYVVLNTWSRVA